MAGSEEGIVLFTFSVKKITLHCSENLHNIGEGILLACIISHAQA